MGTRGPKSAASLSVIAGSIDGRPRAPDDLTAFQKKVWDRTVANESADIFRTAALQQLLRDYCRHVEAADILAGQIDKFKPAWLTTEEGLKRYDVLLKMRDRETKAIADKATKLRLTNQSRYTPGAAATAGKRGSGGPDLKPWQSTG